MTPATVRRVGPSHAAVVAALHEATIGGDWSVGSVERLLALPGAAGLLATRPGGDEPGGFALLLPAGDAMEIAAIGVMLSVLVIVFVLFLTAGILEKALGRTGINVVTRLLGMLLAALAVQFVLDGLRGCGLAA